MADLSRLTEASFRLEVEPICAGLDGSLYHNLQILYKQASEESSVRTRNKRKILPVMLTHTAHVVNLNGSCNVRTWEQACGNSLGFMSSRNQHILSPIIGNSIMS